MERIDMYFSAHMNEWRKLTVKTESSLQAALTFIRENMTPDEVFTPSEQMNVMEVPNDLPAFISAVDQERNNFIEAAEAGRWWGNLGHNRVPIENILILYDQMRTRLAELITKK